MNVQAAELAHALSFHAHLTRGHTLDPKYLNRKRKWKRYVHWCSASVIMQISSRCSTLARALTLARWRKCGCRQASIQAAAAGYRMARSAAAARLSRRAQCAAFASATASAPLQVRASACLPASNGMKHLLEKWEMV